MKDEETEFIFEKLHSRHTQCDFNCGKEEYNEYITEKAYEDVEIRNAQVYVFLTKNRDTLIGYFSLSSKSIRAEIKGTIYDQPLCLLGRMAIQQHFQGKGWGTKIIQKAIDICYNIATMLGCKGVLVETYFLDLVERSFYQNRGFQLIDEHKVHGKTRYRLLYPLKHEHNQINK